MAQKTGIMPALQKIISRVEFSKEFRAYRSGKGLQMINILISYQWRNPINNRY